MTQLAQPLSDLTGDDASPNCMAAGAGVIALFTATLFLSSALLFLVQPMFAKLVLPLLGGTPAVWNTCMVFFQACLLAGYAYSHLLSRWLTIRLQVIVHAMLLATPLLVLPLKIPAGWIPPTTGNPAIWLLLLLTATVGLPFFVVSTTGPLVQKWFAASGHHTANDPYFLYAASNLGSMVALLGYPLIVESLWPLANQTRGWSLGYGLLSIALIACGWTIGRKDERDVGKLLSTPSAKPTSRTRLWWVFLAFVPSSYLLGVTTFVTTDIAAVPLLWVLPLAGYLLTFILVFTKRPPLSHRLMRRLLAPAILGVAMLLLARAAQPIGFVLGVHLAAFSIAAMVCHGELATSRPDASHLTEFYLLMSVGGVLGGLFNALLAPILFKGTVEYQIAIALACVVFARHDERTAAVGRLRNIRSKISFPLAVGLSAFFGPKWLQATQGPALVLGAAVPVVFCMLTLRNRTRFAVCVAILLAVTTLGDLRRRRLLHSERSFYGVHRIYEADFPESSHFSYLKFTELYHGSTIHGRQQGTYATSPLTYYGVTSPIGDVMSSLRGPLNVAVVGLGVGSLAAYADAQTTLTYYEIDPAVVWAAQDSGYFTFLSDARKRGAKIGVILGDARITLRDAKPDNSDLLVLDAFSGDSVPVHLLTRQAMAIYTSKLAPHGLLAVHISNLYLDLQPIIAALARDAGYVAYSRDDLDLTESDRLWGKSASQWVVVARAADDLKMLAQNPRWHRLTGLPQFLWTDDFSNILRVFRCN